MTTASPQNAENAGSSRAAIRILQVAAVTACVLLAAAWERINFSALTGAEVWTHLRTGIWILQNHSVPHTGLFSQYADLRWKDHTWGFDVLLGLGDRVMGLRALVAWMMLLQAGIAAVLFWLGRGSRRNVWIPVLLTAIAQYALWGRQLSPALFSVLLFGIELGLLFRARSAGDPRPLRWLPPLFVVWANLDTQFLYGLLVLALFLISLPIERRFAGVEIRPLPLVTAAIWAAVSFVAPLLNPYGQHVYAAAFHNLRSSPLAPYLPDFNAIAFRRPHEFVLLLLTMTAFFLAGRRRLQAIFPFVLTLFTALLAYSSQLRAWLVIVASVAVIGDTVSRMSAVERDEEFTQWENLVTAGMIVAALVALCAAMPSNAELLSDQVGRVFPVCACNHIRDNHLEKPLFSSYEWGGFVTWYMPDYPANIDTRSDLYGDETMLSYFKLTHAEIPLWGNLSFVASRTLLLPRDLPMAVALSGVPEFKAVYSDEVATVLVKREP